MEKHRDGLAPFSSDECPNSGEDSEEDVITDYMNTASSECDRNPISNGDFIGLNAHVAPSDYVNFNSKDNARIILDLSERLDEITYHRLHDHPHDPHLIRHHLPESNQIINLSNPLVPTISVTPHSPGMTKPYTVLDDSLRRIHEIGEQIHRMKVLNEAPDRSQDDDVPRISTSCPSLCPLMSVEGILQPQQLAGDQDGSDPDLLTNCSTNSSPTQYQDQSHGQGAPGLDRRRSWTDVEDSRSRPSSSGHHLQPGTIKQRSVSLSSLDDSDVDLEMENKTKKRDVNKNCTVVSQSSTHSLNEADFAKCEFKKVVVKRQGQRLGENGGLIPGTTGSRLPLQKSVSTPSIASPTSQAVDPGSGAIPLPTSRHERHSKGGSESETETDYLHISHDHEFSEELMMQGGTSNNQTSLDELLPDGAAYDDTQSEKTRRKRGSIFFRKKKDKIGKKLIQQHQWSLHSLNVSCDYCMKTTTNKPSLHCDNCGAVIHSSQGCKEQFQSECVKSKPSGKSATKSASNVSLPSSASISKRGSTASLPLPLVIGSGNQTISEERDGDVGVHKEVSSALEDFDFDDGHFFSLEEFGNQYPDLGLGRDEPDSWSAAIGRNTALRLVDKNEREIKRQEHIYEFVLTEKHHCLVLLAMDKIFVDGLRRHFNFNPSILERMFPNLHDLIEIHFQFLLKLRQRQAASPVVHTIADILIDQFSHDNSEHMKRAYGEFCSRHRDAVDAYKHYQQFDPRFARFVRHCQNNPLLKKKGIPECILFVTQRLTKYPLLVQPLIKTGVTDEETNSLRKALNLVKDILAKVNDCVDRKERTDRIVDIYHRIDAKSYVMYRGNKFKKSDMMSENRNLKFEGIASLLSRSGKQTTVVVVVLTDILFFLTEIKDHKYNFFAPDSKTGVISLQKLIVREKAGQESRSIFLLSSHSEGGPEMFELKVQKPKDKLTWIHEIQVAIASCPQEMDSESHLTLENNVVNELRDIRFAKLSSDEKRVAKENCIQNILEDLRKKGEEQAVIFEQMIQCHMRLQYALNVDGTVKELDSERPDKEIPDNLRLLRGDGVNATQMWQEALDAYQEIMRLANSLCGVGGGQLSRSVSSAGERHTGAYVPPSLCVPRRAETFAGFDHNKERFPWRDAVTLNSSPNLPVRSNHSLPETPELKEEQDELDASKEKVTRLAHFVHTMFCIISHLMSTVEGLQVNVASFREYPMVAGRPASSRPNPNRQLEELRNLQDQLSREKAEFRATSQQERAQIDEERAELTKWRNQLVLEQRDIEKQRDQLYRKLEALNRQGVSLVTPTTSGNVPITSFPISADTILAAARRKSQADVDKISGGVPQNLFSATNQHKLQQLPVKQQLPLKLATRSNNSNASRSNSITSNNSPDRHSRAGSSPATISSSTLSSPELGPSNKNGSLNHFSMSNRSLRSTRIPEPFPRKSYLQQLQQHRQQQQQNILQSHQSQQQPPLEEEVLFL